MLKSSITKSLSNFESVHTSRNELNQHFIAGNEINGFHEIIAHNFFCSCMWDEMLPILFIGNYIKLVIYLRPWWSRGASLGDRPTRRPPSSTLGWSPSRARIRSVVQSIELNRIAVEIRCYSTVWWDPIEWQVIISVYKKIVFWPKPVTLTPSSIYMYYNQVSQWPMWPVKLLYVC